MYEEQLEFRFDEGSLEFASKHGYFAPASS